VPNAVRRRRPFRRLALGALALAAGCTAAPPSDQGLSDSIAAVVQRGSGATLDVRALAPFKWTRMYVVPTYMTEARIEELTGVAWPKWWRSPEIYNEDRALLIFVDGKRIVTAFDQTNDRGNFISAYRAPGFAPDSARFVVREDGRLSDGRPNFVVKWQP